MHNLTVTSKDKTLAMCGNVFLYVLSLVVNGDVLFSTQKGSFHRKVK